MVPLIGWIVLKKAASPSKLLKLIVYVVTFLTGYIYYSWYKFIILYTFGTVRFILHPCSMDQEMATENDMQLIEQYSTPIRYLFLLG